MLLFLFRLDIWNKERVVRYPSLSLYWFIRRSILFKLAAKNTWKWLNTIPVSIWCYLRGHSWMFQWFYWRSPIKEITHCWWWLWSHFSIITFWLIIICLKHLQYPFYLRFAINWCVFSFSNSQIFNRRIKSLLSDGSSLRLNLWFRLLLWVYLLITIFSLDRSHWILRFQWRTSSDNERFRFMFRYGIHSPKSMSSSLPQEQVFRCFF